MYLPHASHVAMTYDMTLATSYLGGVNHWLGLQLTPWSLPCNDMGSTLRVHG